MSSIGKRVTYLKGLAEGLNLAGDTKEQKLLEVIIEILGDMSNELESLRETVEDLDGDMNVLVEDMQDLEDMCVKGEGRALEAAAHEQKQHQFYAVECPSCQSEIKIDEDVLGKGAIDCPNCGEHLELEE